jgi:hypothetical protein
LVVLVLVVLWVAVLTPRLVRHFREGRSHSSIDSFHQQLHLLERTGPKLVEPAYRLEVRDADPLVPGLALVDGAGAAHATASLVRGVRQKQSAWERRRSRRRRRDLLFALVALAAITGGLGALHALHLLWAITGVSALAIAGYIALVAYAQVLHADRDAMRPVAARPPDVPAPLWGSSRPRHASNMSSSVEILAAGSARAARAGYPGAWDDDELIGASPRHALAGG